MSSSSSRADLRPRRAIVAESGYGFSRPIVWDCLVDPVLAEGWLGNVTIEPVPEGGYAIGWPNGAPTPIEWSGEIAAISPPEHLELNFPAHTALSFRLTEEAGGARGRRTRLVVVHESFLGAEEARAVSAFWSDRLRRLDLLLRGHPSDWGESGS